MYNYLTSHQYSSKLHSYTTFLLQKMLWFPTAHTIEFILSTMGYKVLLTFLFPTVIYFSTTTSYHSSPCNLSQYFTICSTGEVNKLSLKKGLSGKQILRAAYHSSLLQIQNEHQHIKGRGKVGRISEKVTYTMVTQLVADHPPSPQFQVIRMSKEKNYQS